MFHFHFLCMKTINVVVGYNIWIRFKIQISESILSVLHPLWLACLSLPKKNCSFLEVTDMNAHQDDNHSETYNPLFSVSPKAEKQVEFFKIVCIICHMKGWKISSNQTTWVAKFWISAISQYYYIFESNNCLHAFKDTKQQIQGPVFKGLTITSNSGHGKIVIPVGINVRSEKSNKKQKVQ